MQPRLKENAKKKKKKKKKKQRELGISDILA